MQLASSGLRALGRQTAHIQTPLGHSVPANSRNMHTPAFAPRPTTKPTTSSVHNVFKQTRTLLKRLVVNLNAPRAFSIPAEVPHVGRSLHTNIVRPQTIQQGFSAPVRYALSRPLSAPYLPRAPTVPRNVTQIGLGTARNFSTGRPIFQSIAENVPITGRAFWEADWQIKVQKEREIMKSKKYKGKGKENMKSKEMLKERQEKIRVVEAVKEIKDEVKKELDHYFPSVPVDLTVTTYLLIPLAPTPTSRLPLPVAPSVHSSTRHPILPFSYLAEVHTDHATHALRVSTLFARLDANQVFDDPHVACSAYGDPTGMATILEVKFGGWTEARVRSVLGEAGTGWCIIEEVREDDGTDTEAMDDALSEMSFSTGHVTPAVHPEIDPSASFVLPTLDFSASSGLVAQMDTSWSTPVPSPVRTHSLPLSDLEAHNAWSSFERTNSVDSLSDSELSFSDVEGVTDPWGGALSPPAPLSRRSSSGSESWIGLGFSSSFSGRVREQERDWEDVEGPRMAMF